MDPLSPASLARSLLATPPDRDPRPRELALAGALGALAPLLRLPLGPALGVAPLVLLLRGTKPGIGRAALVFLVIIVGASTSFHPAASASVAALAAFAIARRGTGRERVRRATADPLVRAWRRVRGCSGVLGFLALDRENVLYGLVGFHAETGIFVSFPKNRAYLSSVIGGGAIGELSGMGTQTAILLIVNLFALALPRREIRMAVLIGIAALVMGASRHEPMSEHYLTPIVPYLAIGAGVALGYLERSAPAGTELARSRPVLTGAAAIAIVFVLVGSSSLEKKWLQGQIRAVGRQRLASRRARHEARGRQPHHTRPSRASSIDMARKRPWQRRARDPRLREPLLEAGRVRRRLPRRPGST